MHLSHGVTSVRLFSRSSGLGLSTVETILKEKGYVAIVDLKGPGASSFGPASSRVHFWELDITHAEGITKVVEEVVLWTKETGSQLGGVINCAGVGIPAKVGRTFCSLLRLPY